MQQYESRSAQLAYPVKTVYDFLSDFTHFEDLLPEEEVDNWVAHDDSCSFEVTGIGRVGLTMEEKKPHEFLKISGDSSAGIKFYLFIHIVENTQGGSVLKLVLQADLNVFIRAVAEKPLKQFLDMLVGHIETFDFEKGIPKSFK